MNAQVYTNLSTFLYVFYDYTSLGLWPMKFYTAIPVGTQP